MKSAPSIAHVTTVHFRGDTRIRIKEVGSLARRFSLPVMLVVQDGKGPEGGEEGPRVIDSGPRPRQRLLRMTLGSWRMWRTLRRLRPTVVHFHDPELIFLGLAMKAGGTRVVYDVHEDVPRQILCKDWIPKPLRLPLAKAVEIVEELSTGVFDAVVPATPRIAQRFPSPRTVIVQNFPIPEELQLAQAVPYLERPPSFAYVGDISESRAALGMVKALGLLAPQSQARLELAGGFSSSDLEEEVRSLPGWARVNYHGWATRPQVAALLGNVRAGLVLLHPEPNYVEAYPNKMFEYMAAGLPVIASDFPLWREIVAPPVNAGLLVDPLDPRAIAQAMEWMLEHPEEAEAMGRRGRRAVEQRFNWQAEEEKLVKLYQRLLSEGTFRGAAGEQHEPYAGTK